MLMWCCGTRVLLDPDSCPGCPCLASCAGRKGASHTPLLTNVQGLVLFDICTAAVSWPCALLWRREQGCQSRCTAAHPDVQAHEVVDAVAGDLVFHAGVALATRLQLIEKVRHHLQAIGTECAQPGGTLAMATPATRQIADTDGSERAPFGRRMSTSNNLQLR